MTNDFDDYCYAPVGKCDWCKKDATDRASRRDDEEGLYGPIYQVCGVCRKRRDDRLRAEMEEFWDEKDDEFWPGEE